MILKIIIKTFKFLVFAGSQGSNDIINILKKIIYHLKNIPNLKKLNLLFNLP